MTWTGERIDLLRSMWLEGRPAGEIAKALGEVTRNAVMGKVHRLGLIGSGEHNSRMTWTPVGCCRPIAPRPREDVILVSPGIVARAWSAQTASSPYGWRLPYVLVQDLLGRPYDPAEQGHRASLVGLSTIMARGDARKVLVPHMGEPAVLMMMRVLAEKGMVVGGKTPERWRNEENGDAAFFEDMLLVENVTDHRRVVTREMA
jgi:hypothetical protein